MSGKVLILKYQNKKLPFSIKHLAPRLHTQCQLSTPNKHFIQLIFKKYLLDKTEKFPCCNVLLTSWGVFWDTNFSFLPQKLDPKTLSDIAMFLHQGGTQPGLPRKLSQACRRLKPTEERWVKGRNQLYHSFPMSSLVPSPLGPACQRAEWRLWRATLSFSLGRHHEEGTKQTVCVYLAKRKEKEGNHVEALSNL